MDTDAQLMKHLIRLWADQQPADEKKVPDELDVLRSEAHRLLRSFLIARKKIKALGEEACDAVEADQQVWTAHVLLQDVILRLCKFDDDDTRSWSFDQVAKKLRKRKETEKRVAGFDDLLKAFRKAIAHLTQQHRDSYIAHLAKTPPGKDKQPMPITVAVNQALQIIDKLSGKRVEFIEQDGKTDLRAEFEKILAGQG